MKINDDVVNMKLISIPNQHIFQLNHFHFHYVDYRIYVVKVQNTKNKKDSYEIKQQQIVFLCHLTSCKKSTDVTKSANQSNFSNINLSIRRSSFAEQLALQSITNSGVIGIVSSSSLHFAAIYKQPTAKHSRNLGRT
jgi:hypothetical protein